MPVISANGFHPKGLYRNGHYSTFVPYVFGSIPEVKYERVRVDTPDGDFLDLDYIQNNNKRIAVLCHGLEGSSRSSYVLLYADFLSKLGWDVLSINYRGCSGVPNVNLRMYNSGTTGDLDLAILHKLGLYDQAVLIGFSLGGNLILKYLGEGMYPISSKIKCAIAISTPVHLSDASRALLHWGNILYQWKFLWSLNRKIIEKKKRFPEEISLRPLMKIRNLYHFDNFYTAPLFGYKDAEDYYAQNQSIQWLDQIATPSLIINAKDDPFLGPECYPIESAKTLEMVHLCTPDYGGHVGFAFNRNDRSWLLGITNSFIKNYN